MGELSFSSYLQGPLGSAIRAADESGTLPAPEIAPAVHVAGSISGAYTADGPAMRLLGPGHVSGLAPGTVVRADPPPGSVDIEPNYFAVCEVVPAQLPWLLTPAWAESGRLRPWLVLVVVTAATTPLQPGTPLPTVEAAAAELPDLVDSWGWTHVQHAAGSEVARLMCPRRLAADVTYRACLVPAFRSGVAAQNVNLLRWARYYGVDVAWSILCGFPGETVDDYAGQASTVPHLAHLQPPANVDRIWLERFSPLFTAPDRFGVRNRTPEASYRLVYPSTVDLDRMAYFFDYDLADALPDSAYDPLRNAVAAWNTTWAPDRAPTLTYRSTPGFLQIHDTRAPDRRGTYTFEGPLADLYLACVDRPTTANAVRAKLGLTWPVEAVEEAFGEFGRRGLMFLDGNLAVALALPAVPGR